MEDNVYRQHILDHFHNPKFKQDLSNDPSATHLDNPLCGDRIVTKAVIHNGLAEQVVWDGDGCAISQAAADIVCEKLIGTPVSQLSELTDEVFIESLGIEIKPARRRCALLGLECVRKSISG